MQIGKIKEDNILRRIIIFLENQFEMIHQDSWVKKSLSFLIMERKYLQHMRVIPSALSY